MHTSIRNCTSSDRVCIRFGIVETDGLASRCHSTIVLLTVAPLTVVLLTDRCTRRCHSIVVSLTVVPLTVMLLVAAVPLTGI